MLARVAKCASVIYPLGLLGVPSDGNLALRLHPTTTPGPPRYAAEVFLTTFGLLAGRSDGFRQRIIWRPDAPLLQGNYLLSLRYRNDAKIDKPLDGFCSIDNP